MMVKPHICCEVAYFLELTYSNNRERVSTDVCECSGRVFILFHL